MADCSSPAQLRDFELFIELMLVKLEQEVSICIRMNPSIHLPITNLLQEPSGLPRKMYPDLNSLRTESLVFYILCILLCTAPLSKDYLSLERLSDSQKIVAGFGHRDPGCFVVKT